MRATSHRSFCTKTLPSNDDQVSKQTKAQNVTKIGALTNCILAVTKGVVGCAVGSTGLIADAVNGAGDIITDSIVYMSITKARVSATKDKPWGYGKIEPLGALSIGGILIFTGNVKNSSIAALIIVPQA